MDLMTRIAARIAFQLVQLSDTTDSFTVEFGDVYYQAAAYGDGLMMVETSDEQFLAPGHHLPLDAPDRLLRLGFHRPSDRSPNWWIALENGSERDIFAAARSIASALVDVYGVSQAALASALGIRESRRDQAAGGPRPSKAGEGAPLVLQTTQGEVALYRNGVATLNGEQWAESPIREWVENSDGDLGITLAMGGDGLWPHVAIIENSAESLAVLRSFAPRRDEVTQLATQLALAEQYAFACIASGTLYNYEFARASRDLKHVFTNWTPIDCTGWAARQRLTAALKTVESFWFSHSADYKRELQRDQLHAWESIQDWVRLSPFKDDFDFEIMTDYVLPFAKKMRFEPVIQRIY